MKNLKLIFKTVFISIVSIYLSGCMPDSFKKWDKGDLPTAAVEEEQDEEVVETIDPPSNLSYSNEQYSFQMSIEIDSVTPTVIGESLTFSITPTLPSGLSLSSSSGIISGTPTVMSNPANYTITATNSAGYTSTIINIEVRNPDPPEELSYSESPFYLKNNFRMTTLWPTIESEISGYSITPELPEGISFDSQTGSISGTPTKEKLLETYSISATNAGGSATTTIELGTYNEITNFSYGQNDTLKIHITDVTGFTSPDTVTDTSTGASGYIEAAEDINFNTDTINLINVSGVFGIGNTLSSSGGTTSIIKKIENTYLEGETIQLDATLATGSLSLEYSIDPDLPTGLDLNPTTGKITGEMASTINSQAYIVTATNPVDVKTISFSISPRVFVPTQLSYSQQILVHVDEVSNFKQWDIVSSNNDAWGIVKEINTNGFFLIIDVRKGVFNHYDKLDNAYPYLGPEGMISDFFIISVDDASAFSKYDYVSNLNAANGQVYNISNNDLSVRVLNGVFLEGESIDNNLSYGSPLATIEKIVDERMIKPTDLVLTVSDTSNFEISTADDAVDGYVSSATGGGVGLINYVDDNKLYIRVVEGNFKFGILDNIDNALTFSATETTVSVLDGPSIILDATPVSSFFPGGDITAITPAGTVMQVGTSASQTSLYVKVNYGPFAILSGSPIDDTNPYATPAATYTTISNDQSFYLYTRESVAIIPDVKRRTELTFSISPTLPSGLDLDPSSGVISGSPTEALSRTTFVVTAKNTDNVSTTFDFDMVVMESMKLSNLTNNATSYVLHKAGQGNKRSDCRITKDQINNGNYTDKYLLCRLEAGELDLYKSGLKLEFDHGLGLCKHFSIEPFFFYNWQYKKTTEYQEFDIYDCQSCAGCPSSSETPICHGDYSGTGGPNCDDGEYTLNTHIYVADATGDCVFSATNNVITQCEGNHNSCKDGPIKDILSESEMASNTTGILYSVSNDSEPMTWEFSSPMTNENITNRRLANYTVNNSCGDDSSYTYHTNSWYNYSQQSQLSEYPAGATQPIYYKFDGAFQNGNPFYIFTCLDSSYDPRARIILQVRDWDVDFNLQDSNIEVNHGYDRLIGTNIQSTALSASIDNLDGAADPFSSSDIGKRIRVVDSIYKIYDITNADIVQVYPASSVSTAGSAYFNSTNNMDNMETLNEFGEFYNQRYDWDDFLLNPSGEYYGNSASLSRCSATVTPGISNGGRRYPFPEDNL